jgi:hypothetical protein
VRNELTGFDLSHCGFNQSAVLLPLLLGDRGPEVLNLWMMLAHEHDHGDFGNSADPGVANELRIEREQSLGLFGITARDGLPIDDTGHAIEFSESINVGNEFIVPGKRSKHLDLQILPRPGNVNPIVLSKLLEQMNSLMD